MKTIKFTVTDPLGIHARPAGQIVKLAATFKCDIKIASTTKTVDAKRIMGVMGLGVKQGEAVTFTFDGADEAAAAAAIQDFLKANF